VRVLCVSLTAALWAGCAHGNGSTNAAAEAPSQAASESEAERRAAEARIEAMMAPRKLDDPAAAAPSAVPAAPAAAAAALVVVGKAADAASGAIVQADDGRVLYIGGLDAWPTGLLGKRVEVRGRLERRKLAPDPTPGPDGAQRHGMVGHSDVLVDARWRCVEASGCP
jgi:hypothetical protein